MSALLGSGGGYGRILSPPSRAGPPRPGRPLRRSAAPGRSPPAKFGHNGRPGTPVSNAGQSAATPHAFASLKLGRNGHDHDAKSWGVARREEFRAPARLRPGE